MIQMITVFLVIIKGPCHVVIPILIMILKEFLVLKSLPLFFSLPSAMTVCNWYGLHTSLFLTCAIQISFQPLSSVSAIKYFDGKQQTKNENQSLKV